MKRPSMDEWREDAKKSPNAENCGMYLFHNGVVRSTPKAKVRQITEGNLADTASKRVCAMNFSYDRQKVEEAKKKAMQMPGIFYVRVWLNEGILQPGDDIMLVLIGGDIRPHVVECLQTLVGEIKNYCVSETEIYEQRN